MLTRPVTEIGAKVLEIRKRIPKHVYTEIRLGELSQDETAKMVGSLLQTRGLPSWLVDTITDRAEGNPFFVEEIINTFIHDGTLKSENGDWIVTRNVADIHVPDTVQGVLAARIDRLDPDLKRVIQHAAIIGRTFWQKLLSDLINEDIESGLTSLTELDFVLEHGRAALMEDWEWIFRHVLVQEVAYDSVLKEVRKHVHRQIAEWIEKQASDRVDELAPTLARHYELGHIWDKSIDYLSRAADRSRRLFAMREALRFYDRAIALAENHSDAFSRELAMG